MQSGKPQNGGICIGKVGLYKAQLLDLWTIVTPGELLSDMIINYLLYALVEKAKSETGHNILFVDSFTMSKLVDPNCSHSPGIVNKIGKAVEQHDIVIGGVYEPGHWTLVAVYPGSSEVVYMNSFGEKKHVSRVLQGWRNFMGKVSNKKWKSKTLSHPQQHDSSSCGLFVVKFAEHVLLGKEINMGDEQNIRLAMARALLTSSEDISRCCVVCNKQCDGKIHCKCPSQRAFHARCLREAFGIVCDLCSIKVEDLLTNAGSAVFDTDTEISSDTDTSSVEEVNVGYNIKQDARSAVFGSYTVSLPSDTESESLPDLKPWLPSHSRDVMDNGGTLDSGRVHLKRNNPAGQVQAGTKRRCTANSRYSGPARIIEQLQDMGYSFKHAERSVKEGNSKSVEEAIDWIENNPIRDPGNITQEILDIDLEEDEAVLDQPLWQSPRPTSRPQRGVRHTKKKIKQEPEDNSHEEILKKLKQTPFTLLIKPKSVKRCKGCEKYFNDPKPPANLVIQHKHTYPYFNPTKMAWAQKFANGYFHANAACIKPRFPSFNPQGGVTVEPDVVVKLTPAHVKYCEQHGLQLPLGILRRLNL